MNDFLAIQTQTGWGRSLQQFAEWCQPQAGWLCLDAGSGPGLLPALLVQRGCRTYGIDLDASALGAGRLHPDMTLADGAWLPFPAAQFDLITASNLLFLLSDPLEVLSEMRRALKPDGQVCLLNPSEHLSVPAAQEIVARRGLQGTAAESLVNWAQRAEAHQRWSEAETGALYEAAGLRLVESVLKIGPGLARFSRGIKH